MKRGQKLHLGRPPLGEKPQAVKIRAFKQTEESEAALVDLVKIWYGAVKAGERTRGYESTVIRRALIETAERERGKLPPETPLKPIKK